MSPLIKTSKFSSTMPTGKPMRMISKPALQKVSIQDDEDKKAKEGKKIPLKMQVIKKKQGGRSGGKCGCGGKPKFQAGGGLAEIPKVSTPDNMNNLRSSQLKAPSTGDLDSSRPSFIKDSLPKNDTAKPPMSGSNILNIPKVENQNMNVGYNSSIKNNLIGDAVKKIIAQRNMFKNSMSQSTGNENTSTNTLF